MAEVEKAPDALAREIHEGYLRSESSYQVFKTTTFCCQILSVLGTALAGFGLTRNRPPIFGKGALVLALSLGIPGLVGRFALANHSQDGKIQSLLKKLRKLDDTPAQAAELLLRYPSSLPFLLKCKGYDFDEADLVGALNAVAPARIASRNLKSWYKPAYKRSMWVAAAGGLIFAATLLSARFVKPGITLGLGFFSAGFIAGVKFRASYLHHKERLERLDELVKRGAKRLPAAGLAQLQPGPGLDIAIVRDRVGELPDLHGRLELRTLKLPQGRIREIPLDRLPPALKRLDMQTYLPDAVQPPLVAVKKLREVRLEQTNAEGWKHLKTLPMLRFVKLLDSTDVPILQPPPYLEVLTIDTLPAFDGPGQLNTIRTLRRIVLLDPQPGWYLPVKHLTNVREVVLKNSTHFTLEIAGRIYDAQRAHGRLESLKVSEFPQTAEELKAFCRPTDAKERFGVRDGKGKKIKMPDDADWYSNDDIQTKAITICLVGRY